MTQSLIVPNGQSSAEAEFSDLDPEVEEIFGPPPLLTGECLEHYRRLWSRMRSHIRPENVIEECYVRDLVDLSWEIQRYRRVQAGLMDFASAGGLERVLVRVVPDAADRRRLVDDWATGSEVAKEKVEGLLEKAGLGHRAIEAEAFAHRMVNFDRLDQIVTRAESRRSAVLRDIDRHREALGRRAREAVSDITDFEPELIPASEVEALE